jgi:hypothetical protein
VLHLNTLRGYEPKLSSVLIESFIESPRPVEEERNTTSTTLQSHPQRSGWHPENKVKNLHQTKKESSQLQTFNPQAQRL